MKLQQLEITNIRGIRNLKITPNGKNIVILGPNGSGKSAVVDAIDFLLTGRVARLTGEGTQNISLNKHGPHIDHETRDAVVSAVISIEGIENNINLRRCMANPGVLDSDIANKDLLQPLLTAASRGQHVLTRRNILKFITAEKSTRAQEIQELLDISEIDNIRRAFVKLRNNYVKQQKTSHRNEDIAKKTICSTVQERIFEEDVILKHVNQARKVLGAEDIVDLKSHTLKKQITETIKPTDEKRLSIELLEKDVILIENTITDKNRETIKQFDDELNKIIKEIHSSPKLLRNFELCELTELGLSLLDETGNCPLCDKEWPSGELQIYLTEKLENAKKITKLSTQIEKNASFINELVSTIKTSIEKILAAAKLMQLDEYEVKLQEVLLLQQTLIDTLDKPIEKYLDMKFSQSEISTVFMSDEIFVMIKKILELAQSKFPKADPKQVAWDLLTRLEENLKALERAHTESKMLDFASKRAIILHDTFLKARDKIMLNLYEEIKSRFVEFYSILHGEDEANFEAQIQPEGAGLNLEVDFHGRGHHPPHALHSEGHQDSMGLCLYLALSEKLNKGMIDLIILDDVVMSVDCDHRRSVCRLLATCFPNHQFLITTHDRTWAYQLKNEAVIESGGTIEFYNWSLSTGPHVSHEIDMWSLIENDLKESNIPVAAGRLRRGSEFFLSMACDSLWAKIRYKLDRRWDLGDYLPAAYSRLKSLTKKAKQSAQSWGDKDLLDKYSEFESIITQIYIRTKCEYWAVNLSIHFTNWANFVPSDFRDVVDAFKDLFSIFKCSKCGGMLFIVARDLEPSALRCACSKVNWNLLIKESKS
jgi:recombinational DNA repair ATPase RecF